MIEDKDENTKQNQEQIYYYITSFSSIFAGIVGKLICHPFDTLRAKLQIQRDKITLAQLKKNLMIQTFKETIKNEGIKGLYKGLGISIIGTGPAFSIYMTTYEISKKKLSQINFLQNQQGITYFIAGMLAECVSCILWLPIDVIKERLQVQKNLGSYNYQNTMDAIYTIRKTEGITGLYRAYGATIASFGPFSALYFLFYEKLKINFCVNPKEPQFLESILLSGLSGSIAGTIVNPLEVIKLRMQVQRASKNFTQITNQQYEQSNFGYRNLLHGLYLMIKNEGVPALWKGTLAKILYSAPNTAICMSVAEYIRSSLMNQYKKNS